MTFVGQETVRKQHRHLKYTVHVHFNQFIEIMINSHTNPYNRQYQNEVESEGFWDSECGLFGFEEAVVSLGTGCSADDL